MPDRRRSISILDLVKDIAGSNAPAYIAQGHVESNAVAAVQRGDLNTAADAVRSAVQTLAANPSEQQSRYTQNLANRVAEASRTVPSGS